MSAPGRCAAHACSAATAGAPFDRRAPPPSPRPRPQERCTALSALLPSDGNPSTVAGALVAGPDARDGYADARLSPGARVGVHYNAPLVGALAGLLQGGVQQAACAVAKGGFLAEVLPDQWVGA
jgi:hypothetical protein